MYLINIRNFFYRSLLFVFLEEKVISPPPTILLGAKILVLFVLVRVFYVFAFIVLCAYINIGGFRAFLPFRSVVVIVAVAFFLFACFSVFQSFYSSFGFRLQAV